MRLTAALFVSVLTFAVTAGATATTGSHASDPLTNLALWEGRWTFSGQIYQTAYSQAHPDTGIAACAWVANRGYMTCEYFSDNPPHDDLSVLSYSPATKSYTVVLVHKDSPPSQSTLTQNGNTWTTLRHVPDKGKTLVMQTRFVFLSSDKQTTTVSVSADNGHSWTKMIEVTAVKVRD